MKKEDKNVYPTGYKERNVPMSDELQKIFDEEILQGFEDDDYEQTNVVNYSTDGGIVSDQPRSLSETALIRFIRSVLHEEDRKFGKDYLSKSHRNKKGESDDPRLDFIDELSAGAFKDVREDDHEDQDVDEASVVANGGGGPATPLGTGPNGRADTAAAARKRAIDAAERSFGGASQLNESRWAKLAGIK